MSLRTSPSQPEHSVLLIAGLDPSGGAGLVADICTASALGWHTAAVPTLTSRQDTRGLTGADPIDAAQLRDMLQCVLEDLPIVAIKIGALGSPANAETVADLLAAQRLPVVWDPVAEASIGSGLNQPGTLAAARRALLPRCTLATPNAAELEALGGDVQALLDAGLQALLTTDGDGDGLQVCDRLWRDGQVRDYCSPRLPGAFRGTGCRLSTAVACALGAGLALDDAVTAARACVASALQVATRPGRGAAIPRVGAR